MCIYIAVTIPCASCHHPISFEQRRRRRRLLIAGYWWSRNSIVLSSGEVPWDIVLTYNINKKPERRRYAVRYRDDRGHLP